jgi:hypothetical protein
VDDDVDADKRSDRLSEQSLDVEFVGEVGAHGDDGAFGGQDLRDRRFDGGLILEVDDDDCPAPARQRTRDVPAGSTGAARDDRHRLCAEPLRVATTIATVDHLRLELASGTSFTFGPLGMVRV